MQSEKAMIRELIRNHDYDIIEKGKDKQTKYTYISFYVNSGWIDITFDLEGNIDSIEAYE